MAEVSESKQAAKAAFGAQGSVGTSGPEGIETAGAEPDDHIPPRQGDVPGRVIAPRGRFNPTDVSGFEFDYALDHVYRQARFPQRRPWNDRIQPAQTFRNVSRIKHTPAQVANVDVTQLIVVNTATRPISPQQVAAARNITVNTPGAIGEPGAVNRNPIVTDSRTVTIL